MWFTLKQTYFVTLQVLTQHNQDTVSYKGVKRPFQHPIAILNPITHRHQAELENIFNGMAHRGFSNIFCIFHSTFFLAEKGGGKCLWKLHSEGLVM